MTGVRGRRRCVTLTCEIPCSDTQGRAGFSPSHRSASPPSRQGRAPPGSRRRDVDFEPPSLNLPTPDDAETAEPSGGHDDPPNYMLLDAVLLPYKDLEFSVT